jgi:hypothetical protein
VKEKFRVLVMVMVFATNCAATEPQQAIVEDSLLVLPGATEIQRLDRFNGVISYKLNDPYPAAHTREVVAKQLTGAGWQLRDTDLFNPGGASAMRSWAVAVVGGERLYTWSEQWESARGDVLDFSFQYSGGREVSEADIGRDITPNSALQVRVTQIDAETAAKLRSVLK